jgi:hypothetical protein
MINVNRADDEMRAVRENLFQCGFVHQKSHMAYPGIESRPPRLTAGD